MDRKRKRTVKQAEDRRRELLDAGLRVLVAKGSASATVTEIAAAAGVAKGTFYLYFHTKDALIVALRQRETQEMIAALTGPAPEDAPGWWALVDRQVEGFVDFLLDRPDVHDALWHGPPLRIPVPADLDAVRLLAVGIRRGCEAGVFSVSDPELTAALLFHALHGVADVALADGRVDRGRVVAAARRAVRRVLGGLDD